MQGAPCKIDEEPEHSWAYLIYLCGHSIFVSHLTRTGPSFPVGHPAKQWGSRSWNRLNNAHMAQPSVSGELITGTGGQCLYVTRSDRLYCVIAHTGLTLVKYLVHTCCKNEWLSSFMLNLTHTVQALRKHPHEAGGRGTILLAMFCGFWFCSSKTTLRSPKQSLKCPVSQSFFFSSKKGNCKCQPVNANRAGSFSTKFCEGF